MDTFLFVEFKCLPGPNGKTSDSPNPWSLHLPSHYLDILYLALLFLPSCTSFHLSTLMHLYNIKCEKGDV